MIRPTARPAAVRCPAGSLRGCRLAACAAIVSAVLGAGPAPVAATDFYLYYLGGQSNMDGYGKVAELPEPERGEVPSVPIFHGNTAADGVAVDGRGVWETLRPGHGVGFTSDGAVNRPSDRFGVELTFARALQSARPDRRIAIIKYSRGGTSLAIDAARHFGCWDPDFDGGTGPGAGINQYDHFLATIVHAAAVRDIDGDGQDDRLIPAGIVWMQGESDAAHTAETAQHYAANLKRLLDLIRAALRRDDLPIAVGRISDSGQDKQDRRVWDFGHTVREQQKAFVDADGAAALVTSTDSYGYSDPWHYDSAGYRDLGHRFAEALLKLEAAAIPAVLSKIP